MNQIIHDFYVQPMQQVYLEAAGMYLLWTIAMLLLRGKAKRFVARIGVLLAVALILVFTLWRRSKGEAAELLLTPFVSFAKAQTQPEYYRTMFMNILLFLPLGLSLPHALSYRTHHKLLFTALTGILLSVGVEAIQYFFRLGKCETDDVIMNTVGVLLGMTSYGICYLCHRIASKLKRI